MSACKECLSPYPMMIAVIHPRHLPKLLESTKVLIRSGDAPGFPYYEQCSQCGSCYIIQELTSVELGMMAQTLARNVRTLCS